MSNKVYANGREISCKVADGKAICAFPDVCLSPPSPPAGPLPIPYPNTAFAKDTTSGSKTVKISKKEVMLKNKSYFKKSTGDEACTKSFGMGVITHQHKGKVYFNSWSPDVKFEGKNVVRHLDLTTHNHAAQQPGQTPIWPYIATIALATLASEKCEESHADSKAKAETKCAGDKPPECSEECKNAQKCLLSPFGSKPKCCDGKTKHHIVPDHCFKAPGKKGSYYQGINDMSYRKGLCLCVLGKDKNEVDKEHAHIHKNFDDKEDDNENRTWTFEKANKAGSQTCSDETGCNKKCLEQQTAEYYKTKGVEPNTVLRADSTGKHDPPDPSIMGTITKTGGVTK